jgi:hypothetical protein
MYGKDLERSDCCMFFFKWVSIFFVLGTAEHKPVLETNSIPENYRPRRHNDNQFIVTFGVIAYPLHYFVFVFCFIFFFSLFIFFSLQHGFPVRCQNIWSQESISLPHGCLTSLRWFRNCLISCLWVTQSSNIVRRVYGTCLASRNMMCSGVTTKFKYFYNSLQPSRLERDKRAVG